MKISYALSIFQHTHPEYMHLLKLQDWVLSTCQFL